MHTGGRNPSRDGDPTRVPPRLRCFLLLLACLSAGCRGLGRPDTKYDLLTAELRTRERELQEARAEANHLRLLTQTYQRQLSPPGGV